MFTSRAGFWTDAREGVCTEGFGVEGARYVAAPSCWHGASAGVGAPVARDLFLRRPVEGCLAVAEHDLGFLAVAGRFPFDSAANEDATRIVAGDARGRRGGAVSRWGVKGGGGWFLYGSSGGGEPAKNGMNGGGCERATPRPFEVSVTLYPRWLVVGSYFNTDVGFGRGGTIGM